MTSILPPVAPSLQDRLRAAQPCLWTNPGRSAAVAPQLSVGTAMVGVQDMQAARQRFARFQFEEPGDDWDGVFTAKEK